jgi:hypothetical protein
MKTLFKKAYSESVIICMIIYFPFHISDIFLTHISWRLTFSREKEMIAVFVFFHSVEYLLHCKVIFRYRNIVIITFCDHLPFSRKCHPMYSLLLYMKCSSRKINRPTENMTKIVTLLYF